MRRILLLLFIYFISQTVFSQEFSYRKYINKGIRYYSEQEYYQALTEFNAARNLRGLPSDSALVIDDWIELCAIGLRKQKSQATDALSLAEAKELEATIRARQAQALYLATVASETFYSDPTKALRIAEQAFKLDSTHHVVQKNLTDIYYRAQNEKFLLYRKKLIGHTAPILKILSSPTGKKLLSIDWTNEMYLWNTEGKLLTTLIGHKGTISDASYSPNGKYIVSASVDSLAIVWDTDGFPLRVLKKHNGGLSKAVWSPGSDKVLTAGYDSVAYLWDINGELLAALKGHNGPITSAAFSPDGNNLLTSAADSTTRIWNLNGQLLSLIRSDHGYVYNSCFTPNGKNVMVMLLDTALRIYDLKGKMVMKIDNPNKDQIFNVIFSPDGTKFIPIPMGNMYEYTPKSQDLFIYDFKGVVKTIIKNIPGLVSTAIFSGSGEYIAVAGTDTLARVYARDGTLISNLKGHTDYITSLAFANDGQSVYTGSNDFTIIEWQLQSMKKQIAKAQSSMYNTSLLSEDGKYLILANEYNQVELINTGGSTEAHLFGHQDVVSHLAYSNTGQYVLTTGYDRTARVFTLTGVEKTVMMGHLENVGFGCFSSNDKMILTCSDDSTARIWDLTGKQLAVYTEHGEMVIKGCFSPDNTKVLTISPYKQVKVWNLKGKTLYSLTGNIGFVNDAEFSPDGKLILTYSADDILVWDESGDLLTRIEIAFSRLLKARFSPDGNRIIAVIDGYFTTVYDLQGRPLYDLTSKDNPISNAIYSKNGTFILTHGGSGAIKLWNKKGVLLSVYERDATDQWAFATLTSDGSRVVAVNFESYIYQWLTPMGIFRRLQADSSIYSLNILEKENLSIKLDTNDLKLTLANPVNSVEAIDLYLRKAADNPELAKVYYEKTDWMASELKKSKLQFEVVKRLYNISETYGKDYGIDMMLQLNETRQIYNAIKHIRTKISRQSDGNLGLTKLTIRQNLRFAKQCTQLAEQLLRSTTFLHDTITSFSARQYATLAWYLVRNGEFEATLNASKRGLAINDSTVVINSNIAHALLLSGKFDEAAKIYTTMKYWPYSETQNYRQIFLEDFEILKLDLRNEKYNQLMDSMAYAHLYNAIDSAVTLKLKVPFEQFYNASDTSTLIEYWMFMHDSAFKAAYDTKSYLRLLGDAAQLYRKARPLEKNSTYAGSINDESFQKIVSGEASNALLMLQIAQIYDADLPIIYTNIPLAYLMIGQVDRAKQMYREFMNQPYGDGTYKQVFREDLNYIKDNTALEIPNYNEIMILLK